MGVPEGDLRAVAGCGRGGGEPGSERVLRGGWVQPEIRLATLERKPPKKGLPLRRRRTKYSGKGAAILRVIWESASYPWSVRLKALLSPLAALAHEKQVKKGLYGRTKPATRGNGMARGTGGAC